MPARANVGSRGWICTSRRAERSVGSLKMP
jgi:hypothetical protein